MVHVIFRSGAFHWESPEIEALSASIDALQRGKTLDYLGLTGRENIFISSVDLTRLVGVSEEARELKPPSGITVLDIDEPRTIGYGRELLEYKVQFMCDIGEVFHNIVFYIGMIFTPKIKSLESVAVELLQKIPPDIKSGVDVSWEEFRIYGRKPRISLS